MTARSTSIPSRPLDQQGVPPSFVEMRDRLAQLLLRHRLFETLDRDHVDESVPETLAATREDQEGDR